MKHNADSNPVHKIDDCTTVEAIEYSTAKSLASKCTLIHSSFMDPSLVKLIYAYHYDEYYYVMYPNKDSIHIVIVNPRNSGIIKYNLNGTINLQDVVAPTVVVEDELSMIMHTIDYDEQQGLSMLNNYISNIRRVC